MPESSPLTWRNSPRGKAVFLSDLLADDTYTTNYFELLDFMVHNHFLIASSFYTRPDSELVSYREISSSPETTPTQPNNAADFACPGPIKCAPHRQGYVRQTDVDYALVPQALTRLLYDPTR